MSRKLRRRAGFTTAGGAVAASVGACWALAFLPLALAAQQTGVDRWLVTGAEIELQGNPLSESGRTLFPDRNLDVGPGTWTLVRRDGETRFDVSDLIETGEAALAHSYLWAPVDTDLRLTLATGSCGRLEAWLNGQALADPTTPRDVRLADGWNTLFLIVDGDDRCERALSAVLSPPSGPAEPGRPRRWTSVVAQASRPPGVRPNFPEGSVRVSAPRVTKLTWSPDRGDLEAAVTFQLTSWGRGVGAQVATSAASGPPEVDLTGEWNFQLFGPSGIQRLIGRIEMTEDGELSGELRDDDRDLDPRRRSNQFGRGQTFEGVIRDGWVSGRRFGWTLRGEMLGRMTDVGFEGALEAGKLRGTIDLSGVRDDLVRTFESRFEATPVGGDGRTDLPAEAPDVDDRPPDGPLAPFEAPRAGTRGGAQEQDPTGPTDPDGLRSRMIGQLLGSPARTSPAPTEGSVDLRLAGESLIAASNTLAAATPVPFDGSVPFRKLRDAALRDNGMRAEIRWNGGNTKGEGPFPAADVLRALHGTIELEVSPGADGVASVELRVPDVLAGFTVRGLGGSWTVDGEVAADGVICSPCERGRRLRVGYRGPAGERPGVEITDPGYPDAGEGSSVSAVDWLRALEGDNRRYRALAGS